ncbi:uncharacterized protein LOC126570004 [Anopheles aquasalis]|uniref:uncharacterized protein LOC126570004 n=1 Tax=Anopheles aquasalis TaxID=42839 RepID=UPI00215B2F15|nr:uncharacterized protein LOC126570004 [Anopheles aquasalis]
MGGCRCTFRDCDNATASRPELHFFRYPVNDPGRLSVWLMNAKRPEFASLPRDKLTNKVVCQEHFERNMFMNYLRERLTKTAIPRLMPLPGRNERLNVETNKIIGPDVEEEQIRKPPILTTYVNKQREQRSSLEVMVSTEKEQLDAAQTPPLKKVKILNPEVLELKRCKLPGTIVRNRDGPPPLREAVVLNKLASKRTLDNVASEQHMINVPNSANVTCSIVKEEIMFRDEHGFSPVATVQVDDGEDDDTGQMVGTSEEAATLASTPPPAPVPADPALANALEQNTQELANLRQIIEMLANRPVPEPTTIITPQTPAPPMKMEKGPQLTKAQLFNGIKRYLNPTMVTLLRMELFAGSADRQWKSDEKTLAVDLLNIGANVYNHFAQEFRFRLPPVSEVEQWKETGEIDADDAC